MAALFCDRCGTLIKPGVGCPRCDADRVGAWERAHGEAAGTFDGL
jgi:hypothetical protein